MVKNVDDIEDEEEDDTEDENSDLELDSDLSDNSARLNMINSSRARNDVRAPRLAALESPQIEDEEAEYIFEFGDYCLLDNEQLVPVIEIGVGSYDASNLLTRLCRFQLIDPVVGIIESQSSPLEQKKVVDIYGSIFFLQT